jgi:LysR family glycine cleavage system transcriptional activator
VEQGLGVAIGRTLLIDDRLASGKLVAPFGTSDPSGAAYYLCRPTGIAATAAAQRVTRWLEQLAAST